MVEKRNRSHIITKCEVIFFVIIEILCKNDRIGHCRSTMLENPFWPTPKIREEEGLERKGRWGREIDHGQFPYKVILSYYKYKKLKQDDSNNEIMPGGRRMFPENDNLIYIHTYIIK